MSAARIVMRTSGGGLSGNGWVFDARSSGTSLGGTGSVRNGLKALAAGKSYVISGLGNYLGAHGERLVPRRFVTRIAAKLFRPPDKRAETKD